MTTNNASEKLRVDFELVPMTAVLVAMLSLGVYLRDAFAAAMGVLGLMCVAGVCVCEFCLRKIKREEGLETGGRE